MNTGKELLEYKKQRNMLVKIHNVITLICCTILAIVFKNFWIVFVSIFFWEIEGD